jgi:hypothetical protein
LVVPTYNPRYPWNSEAEFQVEGQPGPLRKNLFQKQILKKG